MAKRKTTPKSNPFILIGLSLILIFSLWRYHQVRILSFNTKEVQSHQPNNIRPVYIKSYPLGIDVDVKEASISDGVWAINPYSANYLINSAGIGDGGNIIMYGHNQNDILGPIRYIKEGAMIEITGSDNKIYKYSVFKTDTVNPSNLNYIQNTDEEILTIYTCVGFLDSKRYVVLAKPI